MPYMTPARAAIAVVELRNAAQRYRKQAVEVLAPDEFIASEHARMAGELMIVADILEKRYIKHEPTKGAPGAGIQENLRRKNDGQG